MTLETFIVTNREAILAGAHKRVAARSPLRRTDDGLANGLPVFLDQLVVALRLAVASDRVDHVQIGRSAGRHGHDLLGRGFTIAQVVHDYGDLCQTVTELAVQQEMPIAAREFRILNLCLDDAIAEAVTSYAREREQSVAAEGTERLGVLAHELRNRLNTAMLSFDTIREGSVGVTGSTGLLHGRSLIGLRDIIDRSLAEVRLDAGVHRLEPLSVAELIEDVEIGALVMARARGVRLTVMPVDAGLGIEGDRQILAGAITNFLQNAFKFTPKGGAVSLATRAEGRRVLFDVEDECGGLPPGKVEELFLPYSQRGGDRSGVGLGLAICKKAAMANAGEIHVRDLPGKGCVFTLDLPLKIPLDVASTAPALV